MVGFARALSDGVALAYLADVYVLENHRGRGLGRALLQEMIEDGPGKEFRWLLHTADAHGLYREFGFTAPDATIMERASRRPTATNPPGATPLVPPLLGQSRRAWGVQQGADWSPYQPGPRLPHCPVARRLACGNRGPHQAGRIRRDRTGQARSGGTALGRPDPQGPHWAGQIRRDRIGQARSAGTALGRPDPQGPDRAGQIRRDRTGQARSAGTGPAGQIRRDRTGRPDPEKRRKRRSQGGPGKCDRTEKVTLWP